MSNFSVNAINGVFTYSSANIYSYLGRVPSNGRQLKEAFEEFHITPTGSNNDLKRLNTAMYKEYTEQVQQQMDNQNNKQVVPWAGLCAQIGIQATGDREKDYAAFNNAIQLLSQSAYDGQAMAYFAGLRNEASKVFGQVQDTTPDQQSLSYYNFQAKFL